MRVAYCATCDPAVVIAVGHFSDQPVPTHRINGEVHRGKVIEVPDLSMGPGESVGDYLARVGDTYRGKLK